MLGGLQTLSPGVVAILTGVIYDHAGRTAAYSVAAALMTAFIGAGVWLGRAAWSLRGEPEPAVQPPDVPGLPTGVGVD